MSLVSVSVSCAVDVANVVDTDVFCPPPGDQAGHLPLDLDLRHAGRRRVQIGYRTLGDPTHPAVFVAGGISAGRDAASGAARGWWDSQVGLGKAIDPATFFVITFDWIGADGSLDAPIDPADQADGAAALLDHLGIRKLHAFVGSSYGAMAGLQFAARHGNRLDRLVAISGTHRAHPYSSAWRALQRRAVQLGALQCDGVDGLVLARQMALLSYRTPEEFEARFGAARVVDGRVHVPAEDYLDHAAQAYAARTPLNAFLRLSESIDLQAVEPEAIATPTTLVAIEQDRLVPLADTYALAQRLRGETRVRVLRSRFGHDAFLKEHEAIARVLVEALDAGATA